MEQLGNLAGNTGVYKITFPNGHYYIGQAVNLKRRESQHLRCAKKGVHTNSRFQNCYNKYRTFEFSIIEECSIDELNNVESKYLFSNIDNELCCNMCKEGRSRKCVKASSDTRAKISKYQHVSGKAKPVYMYSLYMDLLARYDSIREAEIAIGAYPKDVQKSCKSFGKYNVKGYKFMFAESVDLLINHVSKLVVI
jgi:predicted GIY-YIG superfamily endonuclease